MILRKKPNIVKKTFILPGGKHSFAHSISCLALAEKCTISNVPNIIDSKTIIDTLRYIFEEVKFIKEESKLHLSHPIISKEIVINQELLTQSRNIFCLFPALLNRTNRLIIKGVPKGCDIGDRPNDWYYDILVKFGVNYNINNNDIILSWREKRQANIDFNYPSMTGTVIALACSCLVEKKCILYNCSVEPSCLDQIKVMKLLGINVESDLNNIIVENSITEQNVEYCCNIDRVYAITILSAAILAETNFKIISNNGANINIPQFTAFLNQIGIKYIDMGNSIELLCEESRYPLKSLILDTGSEPKFSSDWGPFALLILATKTNGFSQISDDVFVKRFQFIKYYENANNFDNVSISTNQQYNRIRAVANIQGKYENIVGGRTKKCPDIRGSAAIILSTIISKTYIEFTNDFQISRGYDNLIGTLEDIGFIERGNICAKKKL